MDDGKFGKALLIERRTVNLVPNGDFKLESMDGWALDGPAAEALFRATYEELRTVARARLRASPRNTLLDTNALVHEWFVRFAQAQKLDIADRHHFMRYAGRAMRTIVIDLARRRGAARRSAGADRVVLDDESAALPAGDEIVRVHEALEELTALHARMGEVVELRYFGGFTEAEIASALGVTERTVRRDWEKARLYLSRALSMP
jgi:RNA polymerase sigma factor (TIGR02999 family)